MQIYGVNLYSYQDTRRRLENCRASSRLSEYANYAMQIMLRHVLLTYNTAKNVL